jgi:beta-N-acetylhexosaminidase
VRASPQRAARVAAAVHLLLAVVLLAVGLAGCSSPEPTVNGNDPEPSASPTPDYAAQAATIVAKLVDADLVGQVLMPSVGLSADAASSAQLVADYRLGGLILMGDVQNTAAGGTAAQVRGLTDTLRAAAPDIGGPNLLLGTDQEYGWVTRIKSGLVQLPSAMTFGAARRPDLTEAAWHGAGQELAAVGINVDFAPDADVISQAGNYIIGSRSFGSDPAVVGPQVAASVRGLQSAGVAAGIKHFPGHGNTTVNSHEALPVLSQDIDQLRATDLPPFQAGIAAGVGIVMSGHLDVQAIDPGMPASFSSKVLIDLLRGELGFQGVVITDALNMEPAMRWPAGEAAVRAMLAGNDLLLMPPDLAAARQGLLDALASGQLPRDRLVQAVTRIVTLKLTLAAIPPPDVSIVDTQAHRDAAGAVAGAAITVLSGSCSGPLVSGPVRVTAADGRGQQAAWLAEALTQAGLSVVTSGGQQVHLVGYGDGTGDLAPGAAITVAMDTPYLLASARSPVKMATYSSTQVAMQAVAKVIAGQAVAAGRSPVAVNGLPASACLA